MHLPNQYMATSHLIELHLQSAEWLNDISYTHLNKHFCQ